jgi:hypothetical protein
MRSGMLEIQRRWFREKIRRRNAPTTRIDPIINFKR